MKNRSHERSPGATADRNLTGAPETDLALESTSSQTLRGMRVLKGSSSGYNPYDIGPGTAQVPAGNSTGMHRMQDMRRLSEWIRLKRSMEHAQDKARKK